MMAIDLNILRLRAQLLLRRMGAPACLAVALLVLGIASWAWTWQQRAVAAQLEARPLPQPSLAVAAVAPPATASENLARFYASLGQQRHAEQQVKQLFDLAAKNGLVLAQGEYKSGYDKARGVATWQVTLPLKVNYAAVWQFALQALRAAPFASLDELSFRREQIADTELEARLRLTFYLTDGLSGNAGEAP
jgi:TRAP-type C4-dicarboxylate transport system permease small subunit